MSQDDRARGRYDHVRCVTCGKSWWGFTDPDTGATEPDHPTDTTCSRYRPAAAAPRAVGEPEPLRNGTASNLAPSIDQAEVARHEVEGGVPTREWAGEHPAPAKVAARTGEQAMNGEIRS